MQVQQQIADERAVPHEAAQPAWPIGGEAQSLVVAGAVIDPHPWWLPVRRVAVEKVVIGDVDDDRARAEFAHGVVGVDGKFAERRARRGEAVDAKRALQRRREPPL